jgi:hypothetical protein
MRVINKGEKIRLSVCQIKICMLNKIGLFLSPYTFNVPIFFISFNLIQPANARRL